MDLTVAPHPDASSEFSPSLVPDEEQPSAQLVLRALGHPNWAVRMEAVESASAMADAESLPVAGEEGAKWCRSLVAAMADHHNAGLRSAAAEVLIRLQTRAIPFLKEALETGDSDTQKFAVDCLGRIGGDATLPALLGAARLPVVDVNVHAALLDALGHVGGQEALALLTEEALGANRALLSRAHALEALARLEAMLPTAALLSLFDEPDLRRLVCPLLANTGDAAALAPLCHAASADARGLKQVALAGLYKLCRSLGPSAEPVLHQVIAARPPGTGERLLNLLAADPGLAEAVVWMMGLTEPGPHLCTMLAHCENQGLAQSAVQAILKHERRALPFILAAIDGSFSATQLLLVDIVEAVGGPEEATYLLGRLPQLGPEMAASVLKPIGKFARPENLTTLLCWADQPQPPELDRPIAQAFAALGIRYPGSVLNALRARLDDGRLKTCWLLAIGYLGQPVDGGRIVSALEHSDFQIRCAALEGAASMAHSVDEQAVLACAYDAEPSVRRMVVSALSAAKTARAEDGIIMLALDRDVSVVLAALTALKTAKTARADRLLAASAESASAPVALAAIESLRGRECSFSVIARSLALALNHEDEEVQIAALGLLVARDPAGQNTHLKRALAHPKEALRLAATELITQGWGDKELYDVLAEAHLCEPHAGTKKVMGEARSQWERQSRRAL